MTINKARLPMEAVTPSRVALWSRIGIPHAAYVSLAACKTSTTVQLFELHAAAVLMNSVSAHRHAKSLGEQLDEGTVARTHFDCMLLVSNV